MAQGPITYGLPGVPFPAVTQAHPVAEPGAVKSPSEVIVMAPCCEAPAGLAARDATGAPTATTKAVTVRMTKRRIKHAPLGKDPPRYYGTLRRAWGFSA